jgi:hypothetical protein
MFYKDNELESVAQHIYNRVIMLVLHQGIEVDPDIKGEIERAIVAHNKKEKMIEQIAVMDNYKEDMKQFVEEIINVLEPILKPLRPMIQSKHR